MSLWLVDPAEPLNPLAQCTLTSSMTLFPEMRKSCPETRYQGLPGWQVTLPTG